MTKGKGLEGAKDLRRRDLPKAGFINVFKVKTRILLIIILLLVMIITLGLIMYIFFWKREPERYQITKTRKVSPSNNVLVDLNKITNIDDFNYLSKKEKRLLTMNGFVVQPSFYDEFFSLYEGNRYGFVPNFITTDSILHNYHLIFDYLLRRVEEEKLIPELKQLNTRMLTSSIEQYDALRGTGWENAARRNVGFFSVGSKLLNPSATVPQIVFDEVNHELNLISSHQGVSKSPVMNMGEGGETTLIETPQGELPLEAFKEDYSQYIPRGHYTQSIQLENYFKAMMWYGRLTFRMKNEDEVKSAILITLALNKKDNQNLWGKVYQPISFFVGKADDITYYQFKDLLKHTYGPKVTLKTVVSDENKFISLIKQSQTLEPPHLNSIPIFQTSFQSKKENEIKGFRFMGQRFTVDADIFQQLIYRNVGDKTKSCHEYKPEETSCLNGARCLPKGLDIAAALGSDEAQKILKEMGETKYACYLENMAKIKKYISGLDNKVWTQNLYWSWLHQLFPLLSSKPDDYPPFMQSSAWRRKDLNTFLGSWTELKHDTILYNKEIYAELGGGGVPERKDDRGYVEPEPELYTRLISLLEMTRRMLKQQNLLPVGMENDLNKMKDLTQFLKVISGKELHGQRLTDKEYELIRSYGGQLEHFWIEVNKDNPQFKKMDKMDFLTKNPAAIVADVATDPNGQILEEGTGEVFEIYVVVSVDNKLKIAKGGVYSYYEFIRRMADRLTDQKWRKLLNSKNAPPLPSWTKTFIAE